jgi:short-subunit dehydrogenase involved in D-alanine esterification of teichoic acids
MNISNNKILITGGASGIGLGLQDRKSWKKLLKE